MSPERASVGDEGEGHSVKMDRSPQKRRGNQKQRRAWHEEYGGSCRVSEAERRVREGV